MYTVKYLPIEGEIQIGDMVRFSDRGAPSPDDDWSGMYTIIEIQNIALAMTQYRYCIEKIDGSVSTWTDDSRLDRRIPYLYHFSHLVGPISPNVKWLDEGDILTEKQVRIQAKIELEGRTYYFPWDASKHPEDSKIVRVQCSTCKTFH